MKNYTLSILFLIWIFCTNTWAQAGTKDSLSFDGQASLWAHYNDNNPAPLALGARYIPSLSYEIKYPNKLKLDFETSANLFVASDIRPFDSLSADGSLRPYRAWVRLSSEKWEIRLGLQKIDFGSATLLRPLMWFDQIDARDPLKLTNGVWGGLYRYYYKNNANLWIWCLYGNEEKRPWDIGSTRKYTPEPGFRYQHPLKKGEIALSYHFRNVDSKDMIYTNASFIDYEKYISTDLYENRIGLDGKIDLKMGLWFEASWIHKNKNYDIFTNQTLLNIGTDYTFKVGNGIHLTLEHFMGSYDEQAFALQNFFSFSCINANYPLSMNDNISAIVYYNWEHNQSYNFVNWSHNFKYLKLFVMGYWNPEYGELPTQGSSGINYGGLGAQLMLVYNH